MIKSFIQKFRNNLPIFMLLFLVFVILSHKVITKPTPFFDWDEVIYAQVGQEMIEAKTIVPRWQGNIWLDKPPFVPLFYGTVMLVTPFIQPEISLRLATIIVSMITFLMLYVVYKRVLQDIWLSTIAIALTIFTPIVLQRTEVVNIDVFLLLGWTGYLLFFAHFWLSFLFLFIAVMSKSLVGFYPAGIMIIYLIFNYITKAAEKEVIMKDFKKIVIHIGILLLWYVGMMIVFKGDFWQLHIIESHTKRVTASIESHFGKRTFYIDLLWEQYGKLMFLAIIGGIVVIYDWFKKNIDNKKLLYSLFLVPWFGFLNVTKTKIFWYGYPYIPQFAFLMVYPFKRVKQLLPQHIYQIGMLIILGIIMYSNIVQKNVLAGEYSRYEDHHAMAEYVRNQPCEKLYVLVEPETREASQTLESMDLLITTSRWWGNHPSIVYYSEKQVEFLYFEDELNDLEPNSCLTAGDLDKTFVQARTPAVMIESFGRLQLYRL